MSTTHPTPDHPQVISRPPRIMLSFLLLGALLDFLWPLAQIPPLARYGIGGPLLLAGFWLIARAMGGLRRAGTPVETCRPTLDLVTGGLYRFSRNPIYLAGFLLYLGIGNLAGSGWTLALFPVFFLVIRNGVVLREERYLEGRFGAPYRHYKTTTHRWLGHAARSCPANPCQERTQ